MKIGRVGALLAAVIVAGVGAGEAVYRTMQAQPRYVTAPVGRDGVRTTVSATGTLNAEVTVQVGTQVSGTIQQLFVDYNSPVQKGQLLARIDPATSQAKVNQAKAHVESAQATVVEQRAAVAQAQADLENAKAISTWTALRRSMGSSQERPGGAALARQPRGLPSVARTGSMGTLRNRASFSGFSGKGVRSNAGCR